jgi:hypothetical protein
MNIATTQDQKPSGNCVNERKLADGSFPFCDNSRNWRIHFPVLISLLSVLAAACATARQTTDTGKAHFAKFGTNKVYYAVEGRGKQAIVFVHCWAGNSGFWREQIPALSDKP